MQAQTARGDVALQLNRRQQANAIRALSMDAIQKANSGHPGMPMGMADIAQVLWGDYLRHNPNNPQWPDRDRFVLSNGHGSMLQYALLHLTGYDLPMTELKNFRQLHSRTPGHPESGLTPGVETTTGPLGQGLANAVGMALAERNLAANFNRDGFSIVDHYTYVFTGDGCLMEGISHEVCSLAGTLGLGKLIVFYDDNGISIDGPIAGWFSDDTPARFAAYGWQVISDVDGHDAQEIQQAIDAARADVEHPTLICCKTQIGYGSPNLAGSHETHGAPLGADEIQATREHLDWPYPPFEIPEAIYRAWNAQEQGAKLEADWQDQFANYRQAYPDLAAEFERRMAGSLPQDWSTTAAAFIQQTVEQQAAVATRKASQNALNGFAPVLPELIGGSADLTPSNNTTWKGSEVISREQPGGNYIHFGVREFGMYAVLNGIALHGGFIPYGGTFLVFSDYARNALRMAAITNAATLFIFTHDSIGLGEDGPTHQPIEHTTSLRIMPNMQVWRPCDGVESAVAWRMAIERRDGPTSLLFSRQTLPHQPRTESAVGNIQRGAYVLSDCEGEPEAIIIATGSEVSLAMEAQAQLSQRRVRVVSMPCCECFDAQDADYQESVLPRAVTRRIAVEAGVSAYWWRYVGLQGQVIGIDRFGESAPGKELFESFGFSVERVVQATQALFD